MLRRYLLDRVTEKTHAFVENRYCIRTRSKSHVCKTCQSSCPAGALVADKGKIKILEENCLSCNICNASCPGKAFNLKRFDYSKFIKQAKNKDLIVTGCQIGEAEGNLVFPCLNSLPIDFVIAFLLINRKKEVFFNLRNCKDCVVKGGYAFFLNNLFFATKFLSFLSVNIKTKPLYAGATLPEFSLEDDLSRKELFSYLKDETKDLAIRTAFDIIKEEKKALSPERNLLINALKRITTEDNKAEKIPAKHSTFANMVVTSSCNACGYCQAICPRKAWLIENDEEVVSISHNIKECLACGLCQEGCPQKAIKREEFQLNLLSNDLINKRDLTLTACPKCRRKFVLKAEDQLCYSCEKREQLRKSLIKK